MDPIIYILPNIDNIPESNLHIKFNSNPNAKLIKYGFNNVNEQLNIMDITSNEYYQNGLEFNFMNKENDSISHKIKTVFGIKPSQTFCEIWEIMTLFGMFKSNKSIYCNSDILPDVADVVKASNSKITVSDKAKKADIVIYKYSNVDINENTAVQLIISILSELLGHQAKGSSMILQLFDVQTQPTVEIIYFLSSLYSESFIIKPSIVSDLFSTKYVVLTNLKTEYNLKIPKHNNNAYLQSLGLAKASNVCDPIIQCMNSKIIPAKYIRYNLIKSYLDTKVYHGATYQELINSQRINAVKWIDMFKDIDKLPALADKIMDTTNAQCNIYSKLMQS